MSPLALTNTNCMRNINAQSQLAVATGDIHHNCYFYVHRQQLEASLSQARATLTAVPATHAAARYWRHGLYTQHPRWIPDK